LTWYPFTYILQPIVETNSATEISATKAKLNGTLSNLGAASAAKVWFEYKKANEDWPTNHERYGERTITSPGTSFSYPFPLEALSPSTTYHFRAVAENTHGTSYGKVLSFTTTARPEFNFTLTIDPNNGLVAPGGSSQTTITVTMDNPESNPQSVSFSATDLPNNTTFSADPCTPSSTSPYQCTSTATIQTSVDTPVGVYTIKIGGNNLTDAKHSQNYTLTVGGVCQGEQRNCWEDSECIDKYDENGNQVNHFKCRGAKLGYCKLGNPDSCKTSDDCHNLCEYHTCSRTRDLCDDEHPCPSVGCFGAIEGKCGQPEGSPQVPNPCLEYYQNYCWSEHLDLCCPIDMECSAYLYQ